MVETALSSPVWRIAAATGEEPADVEASIAILVAEGFTHAEVWELLDDGLRHGETVVSMTERVMALRATMEAQ